MKIGVFDSGVGGKSVVQAIKKELPKLEIIYKEDRENLPYGNKTAEELKRLVLPIMQSFVDEGCALIVIACNTVTTTLATFLREELPIPIVGLEPMVKPAAAMTKSGTITVCATPATLKSERYAWLKQEYAKNLQVLEPDCSDWAKLIEDKSLDHQKISERITAVCEQGTDVIVLGCTHYHWIQEDIQDIASDYNAIVIQPESAVISQLKRVLARLT